MIETTPTAIIPMAAVESGDLLAWQHDLQSTYSDFIIHGIRRITKSKYGHVGIAWRLHDGLTDELMVVEASVPRIRITRITTDQEVFCVKSGVTWGTMNKSFLVNKIGLPYGFIDAARAALGRRVSHDMHWQCAELAHGFYEASGILLPPRFRPGDIVEALEKHSKHPIARIVGPGRPLNYY